MYAISKKLKEYRQIEKLQYGFEVIDGKLINNPEILFIGINPGAGDKKNNRNILETERISYLDVFDEDYRYHLAEKTINFFKIAGWNDKKIIDVFSNNAVKTNLFYLSTDNEANLKKVLRHLNIEKEYNKKSIEFTVNLIKILKPKIVILEGKSVFNYILAEWYPNEKDWNEQQFTIVKDKNMNTTFLAYNRNISNVNRAIFVKKLKQLLNNE